MTAQNPGFAVDGVPFHAPVERFLSEASVRFTLQYGELARVLARDRVALILFRVLCCITWLRHRSIARGEVGRSVGNKDWGRIEEGGN